jgi:hypothetical protein
LHALLVAIVGEAGEVAGAVGELVEQTVKVVGVVQDVSVGVGNLWN